MVKSIFDKLITLGVWLKYPNIPNQYRFFIRFRYIGKLYRFKFWWRDYVIKKPYKKVYYDGEFAPELKFVLPFAYWHYLNGSLLSTSSSLDTSCFYFFSKHHKESSNRRIWNDFKYDLDIPNSEDHNIKYDYNQWTQVPLKEHYRNSKFIFEKPILVISNKFNEEWGGKPINFLSKKVIKTLFKLLSEKYHVIYNRPGASQITHDNSAILELGEDELLNNFRGKVDFLNNLWKIKGQNYSFNTFQLLIYANCNQFISVQGGNSVLASYFGGTNIILAKKGHELFFNEFQTIYPKLSGCKIISTSDEKQLIRLVEQEYMNN